MQVMTISRLRAYRRCPKEHFYGYTLGYRAVRDAESLRFGRLVHLGLEAWWKAPTVDARLPAALAALATEDPIEQVRAEVALQGYDVMWRDEPLVALPGGVEAQFAAPLVNPATGAPSRTFTLGGKLDVLVRDTTTGRVKIVEHKTASSDVGPGSPYWRRLVLDGQVSTYYAGARALGHDVEECIYDVLGKPQLRPSNVPVLDEDGCKIVLDAQGIRVRTKDGKKWRQTADTAEGWTLQTRPETPDEFRARLVEHVAENPQRYYQRGAVVRLEQEVADAAYDLWTGARQIRESEVMQRWPRNPEACERKGSFCPFWEVCSGEGSIDDPQLYRRAERTHEELTTDAA